MAQADQLEHTAELRQLEEKLRGEARVLLQEKLQAQQDSSWTQLEALRDELGALQA